METKSKTIKYEPLCCVDDVISGHATLRKPSIQDLFEAAKISRGIKDGEQDAEMKIIEWSKKFYIEVKFKNIDGSKYESFDDLMGDAECLRIVSEIAQALSEGLNRKKFIRTQPKTQSEG
jgi:hypothetical protein